MIEAATKMFRQATEYAARKKELFKVHENYKDDKDDVVKNADSFHGMATSKLKKDHKR